jgi:hypothetical protein
MTRTIVIAEAYSKYPAGRFPTDGPNNGEKFRDQILGPALRGDENVEVNLDGVMGLPSSFLEEAFGGLLRIGFNIDTVRSRLKIVASEPRLKRYPDQVWWYINSAAGEV